MYCAVVLLSSSFFLFYFFSWFVSDCWIPTIAWPASLIYSHWVLPYRVGSLHRFDFWNHRCLYCFLSDMLTEILNCEWLISIRFCSVWTFTDQLVLRDWCYRKRSYDHRGSFRLLHFIVLRVHRFLVWTTLGFISNYWIINDWFIKHYNKNQP